jgi:hypothetical protein
MGCKKDTIHPNIKIVGSDTLEIIYGIPTGDPGATASDSKDGDITNKIKSNWSDKVDFENLGVYKVTYYVEDKKGNEATADRTVIVKLNSNSYLGEYNTTWTVAGQGTSNIFTSTITKGGNENQFVIYPFKQENVYLKVSINGLLGNELSFSQTDGGVYTEGNGSIQKNGEIINLTFTSSSAVGGTFNCNSTLTKK